ncbi:histone H3-like [Anopheles coustani]|uniref:histone H3-like n=1 Tax=Anopheles coustani TaxID=139045 RepID=UPI00265A77F6|nr:histone H3-like [Anopheles coustani]
MPRSKSVPRKQPNDEPRRGDRSKTTANNSSSSNTEANTSAGEQHSRARSRLRRSRSSESHVQPPPTSVDRGGRRTASANPPRRLLPSTREMIKLQNTTTLLIPKLSISRVIREVMHEFGDFRVTIDALEALHESTEMYLVDLFERAQMCATHRNRVTLQPKDMKLALYLGGQ